MNTHVGYEGKCEFCGMPNGYAGECKPRPEFTASTSMTRQQILGMIRSNAELYVEYEGATKSEALVRAAQDAAKQMRIALKLNDGIDYTHDDMENHRFMLGVALDVEHNIYRPSTGKTRDFILGKW